MKKRLLLILSLATCVVHAQQTTFNKVFYEPMGMAVESRSVAKTFDNGCLIAGKASYYMGYLLKTDANGVEVWNKFFNPSPNSFIEFNRIIPTTDSCFVICGSVQVNLQNAAIVIKVNGAGDTLWTKTYGRAGESLTAYNVAQTLDGGFILTGVSSFGSAPYTKWLLIKADVNGNLQWMQTMQANNERNTGYSVKQDADSNYVVTGYLEEQTGPSAFDIGMCMAKFSRTGAQLWAKKYSLLANTAVWGYDFEITPTGYMCYFNYNYFDAVIKTDLLGNIVSGSRFDLSSSNAINQPMPKLKRTHDGGFVFVSGNCFGPNIVYKVDAAGAYQWAAQLFLNAAEIVETNNNELFIAGSGPMCGIRASQVLYPQIGILQTDSLGNIPGSNCLGFNNITPVAITLNPASVTFTITSGGAQGTFQNIEGAYTLTSYDGCVDVLGGMNELGNDDMYISPNPATSMITISGNKSIVATQAIVYDVFGRKIKEQVLTDNYNHQVNIEDLPPATYILSVNSKGTSLRKKFIKQ